MYSDTVIGPLAITCVAISFAKGVEYSLFFHSVLEGSKSVDLSIKISFLFVHRNRGRNRGRNALILRSKVKVNVRKCCLVSCETVNHHPKKSSASTSKEKDIS